VTRKLVLLDLDGTLVDSAPAILTTLRAACASCGVTPLVPLDAALIGPPLRTMLERLVGENDTPLVARLEDAFRETYDLSGYRDTATYPLLHDALRRLRATDCTLVLVTNKRRVPTLRILDLLDVANEFEAVYTMDSFPPDRLSKSELVARALAELPGAAHSSTVMVGDTREDQTASVANSIGFIAVTYGYGFSPNDLVGGDTPGIGALAELPAAVARLL
jgi:phosphoglycolate phosphatase